MHAQGKRPAKKKVESSDSDSEVGAVAASAPKKRSSPAAAPATAFAPAFGTGAERDNSVLRMQLVVALASGAAATSEFLDGVADTGMFQINDVLNVEQLIGFGDGKEERFLVAATQKRWARGTPLMFAAAQPTADLALLKVMIDHGHQCRRQVGTRGIGSGLRATFSHLQLCAGDRAGCVSRVRKCGGNALVVGSSARRASRHRTAQCAPARHLLIPVLE